MKKYYLFTTLVVSILFFNGCFGLRSAEGLSEGEVNLSYVPEAAGVARYGVTNNIESRLVFIPVLGTFTDVYLHTSDKKNFLNGGICIGVGYIGFEKPQYILGVTLGKEVSEYIKPYFSYARHQSFRLNHERWEYFSLGSEAKIFLTKNKGINLLFVPEITYSPQEFIYGGLGKFTGTISLGLTINTNKIF